MNVNKKTLVDEYPQFRIATLIKGGYLNPESKVSSSFFTLNEKDPKNSKEIYFKVDKIHSEYERSISITTTSNKSAISHKIILVSTPCNYGGHRWWFMDPCSKTPTKCSILYLQKNGYLAGRKTLNLTYKSRIETKDWLFDLYKDSTTAIELLKNIKYPYRNGKPTKKMAQVLKYKARLSHF